MNTDENRRGSLAEITFGQSDVLTSIKRISKNANKKPVTKFRGEFGCRTLLNKTFVFKTIFDEIFDRTDFYSALARKLI